MVSGKNCCWRMTYSQPERKSYLKEMLGFYTSTVVLKNLSENLHLGKMLFLAINLSPAATYVMKSRDLINIFRPCTEEELSSIFRTVFDYEKKMG